ncbi:AAA family ATPase [Effusibacillus consociatus]|uniref:CpaE family protein n=1 Tax=Effusibacillus consociatus TaxID=1117041 RepID=A0ABV9PYP9_9BACL
MKLQIFRPQERHDWIRDLRNAGLRVEVIHRENQVKDHLPIVLDTTYGQWQTLAKVWRNKGRDVWLLLDSTSQEEEGADFQEKWILIDWPVEKVLQQLQEQSERGNTRSNEREDLELTSPLSDGLPLSQRRKKTDKQGIEEKWGASTAAEKPAASESKSPSSPRPPVEKTVEEVIKETNLFVEPPSVSQKGEATVLAVYGAKGGIGKTTFLLNLAALFAKHGVHVAVLDLDLFLGTLLSILHIHPRRTITDAVRLLGDPEELASCFIRHEAGFFMLASPTSYMDVSGITEEALAQLFVWLKEQYQVVLIDTSPFFDDLTSFMLGQAHRVALMTTDEPASVKNLRKMVPYVTPVLQEQHTVELILNRTGPAGISLEEIGEFLPWKPTIALPEDPLVQQEGKSGRCVALTQPDSPYVRQLQQYAERWGIGLESRPRPWTLRIRNTFMRKPRNGGENL